MAFEIHEIFDIRKGERLIKQERISGTTPLVVASSKNNGIVEFVDFDVYKEKKQIFENVISIDMFFNVFYQKEPFFCDDNVHCLTLKCNQKLNEKLALFLISVLKVNASKYDFGRQLRLKRLNEEYIKLPTDEKGNPDLDFMENCIKDFSVKIKYGRSLNFIDTGLLKKLKYGGDTCVHPRIPGVKKDVYAIYARAKLIETLAPDASAVLARKCLESMILDFHKIERLKTTADGKTKNKTLADMIKEIESRIDIQIKDAFENLCKVGNMSVHMEEPSNIIQDDINPEEAKTLLDLIEVLFQEWYQ